MLLRSYQLSKYMFLLLNCLWLPRGMINFKILFFFSFESKSSSFSLLATMMTCVLGCKMLRITFDIFSVLQNVLIYDGTVKWHYCTPCLCWEYPMNQWWFKHILLYYINYYIINYVKFCMEYFIYFPHWTILASHVIFGMGSIYLFCHLDYDLKVHCFVPWCSLINWWP